MNCNSQAAESHKASLSRVISSEKKFTNRVHRGGTNQVWGQKLRKKRVKSFSFSQCYGSGGRGWGFWIALIALTGWDWVHLGHVGKEGRGEGRRKSIFFLTAQEEEISYSFCPPHFSHKKSGREDENKGTQKIRKSFLCPSRGRGKVSAEEEKKNCLVERGKTKLDPSSPSIQQ